MQVAVVGAGLAGLACAVDLARAGVDVRVFEAGDRVGGRAWSDTMPDGAVFERGGEFIEDGYDHFRRRAAEYGLALIDHGFEFAARELRADGQRLPALLLAAQADLAATVDSLGPAAADASAAQLLERTPLPPLVRLALTRRLEGTYAVELDRVSATWLASGELRAGTAAHRPSARLAAGNDALARSLAGELGDRVRLGCAVHSPQNVERGVAFVTPGGSERCEHMVAAVPLSEARSSLLPALRERSSYARLQWGVAAKLHVPLARPAAPAAVQGLEAAFWAWTAAAADGALATVASSFAGGARALETLSGPRRWLAALQQLWPELALAEGATVTRWSGERYRDGAYAAHPPGWSARDDEEVAAPHGRIHLAGEHTAAEFCGTLEGALRSGARAAAEVLAEARAGG